jgi:hypothetical protein
LYRLPVTRFRPLVVLTLVVAAPGPALGALTPPEQASRGPLPARSVEVTVGAGGDAAAVWVRGAGRAAGIVVSVRPSGGTWGDPVAISRRGRPAIDPEIAIDAQGRVVVVWRQVARTRLVTAGGRRRRQAVYVARTRERLVGETRWSAITTLSSDRQKIGPPELGMSDDGTAVVTWHWGTGTSPADPGFLGQVQFVERRADGTWSGPQRLSRSTLCAQVRLPQVAVGSRGHAAIWWQCDLPADRSTALAVSRAPGQPFGGEVELPFETDGRVRADLAIAADGRAVAVSARDLTGTLAWWRGEIASTLTLSALPLLGTPERVDPTGGAPAIAVNAAGDALSGWVDAAGRPRVAPIASGLGVGAPSTLGPADDSPSSMRVAVGDDRHGAAAWVSQGRVQVSTRAVDGTMPAGEEASQAGVSERDPPAIAIDAGGALTLAWTRTTRARSIVERASGSSP